MMEANTLKKPQYRKDPENDFFPRLRQIVSEEVNKDQRNIYTATSVKAAILFVAYFGLYTLVLLKGNNLAWLFIGYIGLAVTTIMIFLNVVHDAAHNALFRSKFLNEASQYALELFGTNSYIWRIRHVRLHHAYPNIPTWDCDIEQSDLVKIFPDSRTFWFHKYQHIYLPILYFTYTLNWLFIRDFRDFFSKDRIVRKAVDIPKIEFVKLFATKLFYVFYMLIIPILVLQISWYWVLLGFLSMHVVASGMGLVALLSTHAGENATWTYPDTEGRVNQTWAFHQMISTNDFAPKNAFINFTYGCFNHHIAHHLFPSMSHSYYPQITDIIQQFAKENNLPYRCLTAWEAITSHFKLLRNNAYVENIFEETM